MFLALFVILSSAFAQSTPPADGGDDGTAPGDVWQLRSQSLPTIPIDDGGGGYDFDLDGWEDPFDCDDGNPAVYPGALEVCNGIDDDCDNQTDEGQIGPRRYRDYDGDTYGDSQDFIASCFPLSGRVSNNSDCNDYNNQMYPGNVEVCDGLDNNCANGVDEGVTSTFYVDADSDGYGGPNSTQACSAPGGYVANNGDCNDNSSAMYPGRSEVCDGLDNNCANGVDEGVTSTYYVDADSDGYGGANSTQACSAPGGHVANSSDCNDSNNLVYPGRPETCDGLDNNCANGVDEGVTNTYYVDNDSDGYGGANSTQACSAPGGYVANNGDCNDNSSLMHPGRSEICDGLDNNCAGGTDEGVTTTFYDDGDSDGFGDPNDALQACSAPSGHVSNGTDCNDGNNTVYPGRAETCDGLDNNCAGGVDEGVTSTFYDDDDGDGHGDPSDPTQACSAPSGHVASNDDCDDTTNLRYPGRAELCDGIDNDCDTAVDDNPTDPTAFYTDADADGYGAVGATAVLACSAPGGHAANATDCNDASNVIHPGRSEACNDIDDDCDNQIDEGIALLTWYDDVDDDGYGGPSSQQDCGQPAGWLATSTDCDDTNPARHPGATETCNNLDDDCDSQTDEQAVGAPTWYADADNDTFGGDTTLASCTQPAGHVANSDDCDDTRASANPDATEQCNGLDDDCDGVHDNDVVNSTFYLDDDGDGYGLAGTTISACAAPEGYAELAGDCDDTAAAMHPGVPETCNGIDDDCDNLIDDAATDATTWYADADGDGHGNPNVSVAACEVPAGHVATADDCNDTRPLAWTGATEVCDGVDNDCDGLTDPASSEDAIVYFRDADSDTFGDEAEPIAACVQPAGYALVDGDCDDLNAGVNPDADEVCDTRDNDCDGTIDVDPIDPLVYFEDLDGDGYGTDPVLACRLRAGLAEIDGDCDDTLSTTNPDAYDQCDDLIDNNCDGTVDENDLAIDWYIDLDGDNVGTDDDVITSCARPEGYAATEGDCDDDDPLIRPGAQELCDNVDNDCDTQFDENPVDGLLFYYDLDADGFGDGGSPVYACVATNLLVTNAGDCDDDRNDVAPYTEEICDGFDNDCNTSVDDNPIDGSQFYPDTDGDGYGSGDPLVFACTGPLFSSPRTGDCNDADATVNPMATEVCGGVDENCNGAIDDADPRLDAATTTPWWRDLDGDGFGAGMAIDLCAQPEGMVAIDGDCDDTTADVSPAADDVPGDGVDNDCDGIDLDPDLDSDGDGVPDLIELLAGGDPGNADTDGDGIPDGAEGDPMLDTDGDGLTNLADDDDDGDGIPTLEEGTGDQDADGIANYLDTDADGDDVPDSLESKDDTDGDGMPDYLDAGNSPEVTAPEGPTAYGCGCNGTPSIPMAPWWLAVLALPLARRRR